MGFFKVQSVGIAVVICAAGLLFLALGGDADAFGLKIALGSTILQVIAGILGLALIATVVWVDRQKEGASPAAAGGAAASGTVAQAMPGEGVLFALDDPGIEQLSERLKEARQVSMIMRTGISLFNQYEALFKSLVADGCKLRIILCDPASPVARTIYGGNDDSLKSYLQTVEASILRIKGADANGLLAVKLVPYAPTFSLMMIEHQRPSTDSIQVSLFFTHTKYGRDRPNFILSRSNRWFATFATEFEAAWKVAAEWKLV